MTAGAEGPGAGLRPGTPAYRRANGALFLASSATFSLLYCVQPLLPAFAAEFRLDAAGSSLALSLSTFALAGAIMVAAAASERLGRRLLMAASLALAAVLALGSALAPGWVSLLVLRTAEGFVLGGVPAVAMSYLSEEVEPAGLGFAMGLYVGGSALGGLAGRIVAGLLAEWAGWRVALAALGVAGLAGAVAFALLLPPSRNFTPRRGLRLADHLAAWARHARDPALRLLFATGFLVMGGFVTVYNYTGFRLLAPPYGLGQTGLSLIFTAYLLGTAASSAAGALADRLGRRTVLPLGLLIAAAGVCLTVATPLPLVVAGIATVTVGFFAAHTVASSWVGRRATTAKGHASSLYLLSYYLGSSLAGSAGGLFWTAGGWPAVAGYVLALFTLALLCAWRLHRIPPIPTPKA